MNNKGIVDPKQFKQKYKWLFIYLYKGTKKFRAYGTKDNNQESQPLAIAEKS